MTESIRKRKAETAIQRWYDLHFTHALRAVDEDRIRQEFATSQGPLAGLLISVKDVFEVAGIESCAGSLLLAGNIPNHDAPAVAALRSHGATVFGKGVCAEFGFGVDTENRLDGRVVHPFDPAISPGGSSGGDAVAVGAGIVDAALAGDYGGSARWPAQAMNILGLRPGVQAISSRGRIPALSGLQAELETPSIMTREPATLRRIIDTLGLAPRYHWPHHRILLTIEGPVTAEVEETLRHSAEVLRATGIAVDERDGLFQDAAELYGQLRASTDDHAGVRSLAAGREDFLYPNTRKILENIDPQPAVAAGLGPAVAAVRERVRDALRDADAILLPLAASPAMPFDGHVTIAGEDRDITSLMHHCRAVSLTGLPALAVPIGVSATGAGISVQLVGRSGGERMLCSLAERLMNGSELS